MVRIIGYGSYFNNKNKHMCETKAILIDTSEEGCIEATPGAVKGMSGGP